METEQTPKGPGGRLVLLTAVLALALVSAVAFGRVFQGTATTFRLALVGGASVLLAAALERRHILIATAATAVGLALVVAHLLYPETTRYWLPTSETLRAALKSWGAVGRTAETEVAPALPLTPLLLASVIAVWAASFAMHALAVRASSPFLSLLPPGALLSFASLVVNDGSRPLYVVAFLGSAMLLLYADGLRRVGQWGPITEWHGRTRLRLGTAASLRGARRVALIALIVAVFLPGILPGYGSPALVQVNAGGNIQRLTSNPIIDIRPALTRRVPIEVFTVRSSTGAYWRSLTLDRFDGNTWRATDPYLDGGAPIGSGLLPAEPGGPGADVRRTVVSQTITWEKLSQPWVVAAYAPVSINTREEGLRYDPSTGTLVLENGGFPGLTYDVTSRALIPTPAQLDTFTLAEFSPDLKARYTQLPAEDPGEEADLAEIRQIAQGLTTNQPHLYRKILAIQNHLRTRFRYDLNPQLEPGRNPVLSFLTTGRAGYCVQFASAMAVMLRTLGIPARLALGWAPGVFDPEEGVWRVTNFESHVWVEVPFPRYGWLSFEPTPRAEAVNPQALAYQQPLSDSPPECLQIPRPGGGPVRPCDSGSSETENDPGETSSTTPPPSVPPGDPQLPTPGDTTVGPSLPGPGWRGAAPWLLGAIALILLLAIPAGKAIRRRVIVARAGPPRERVLAAYRLMSEQAADAGLRRRPHETLPEYRVRLRASVAFSDGDLDRLTALAAVAAYSDREIPPEQAEEAVEAARRAARDIGRSQGAAGRAVGLYRMRIPSLRR